LKVVVDFDVCQSNGLCMEECPEVFELRDDGYLYVLQEEPTAELAAAVEQAVKACPTGAISLQ
jgi:ferredoxin